MLGGAGPAGVDVIRQGILGSDGFMSPHGGSVVLRHAVVPWRPEPDPAANVFERRQTPSVLGLGLLARIPDSAIEAQADPNDDDDDGISGVAHRLPDGQLGRFGWKANVPTIREFVRDALSNELGLTLDPEPDSSFGLASDEDSAPDPELGRGAVDAITTFIDALAPPPRLEMDPAVETAGEALFVSTGCADCHTITWSVGGQELRAFTDLLLHDVAEPDASGIAEGLAGVGEFRTPPLWGVRDTPPYMHDGSASTLEAAVAAHAGEAEGSRSRVEALNAEERAVLVRFLESL